MKLKKAIEIQSLAAYDYNAPDQTDSQDAIKIGIEATKRLEAWRAGRVTNPDLLLPGETED